MTSMAIEAEHLVKHFGDTVAVDDVSFSVPQGSVLGLLGPNGAGKTTTVRMMTTLTTPTSGTARVAGHDVLREPDHVRRSMGLTGQAATVDELLTGRENIRLIGALYGLSPAYVRQAADDLLERFSLTDAGDRVVKTYSGGMRRRLDLAVSLDRDAARAVPRRADHRARPAQPGRAVGGAACSGAGRHHPAADHAVPRGGRPAGRPHRRHRPRPRSSPRARRSSSRTRAARPAIVVTVSQAQDLRVAEEMLRQHVPDVHVDEAARQLTAPAEGLADMTRIAAVFERQRDRARRPRAQATRASTTCSCTSPATVPRTSPTQTDGQKSRRRDHRDHHRAGHAAPLRPELRPHGPAAPVADDGAAQPASTSSASRRCSRTSPSSR